MRLPPWLFVAAVGLLATLLGGFAIYLGWHESIDDAAITFAYSKNLIGGNGLVLTPGAERVEGYTTFLWMLFMAPVIGLGLDAFIAAKVAGIAFSVGAIGLLARVPSIALQRPPHWLDLLAPALTVAALPFALWAVSGMENALVSLLLVLAVALTMREINRPESLPLSSLAFVALALTRPEGLAYWAAAAGHRVLLVALGRRTWSDLKWLGGFLLPFGLYHLWHFAYFQALVPNTYFAKAGDRSLLDLFRYVTIPADPGFTYVRNFFTEYWPLPSFSLPGFSPGGRDGLSEHAVLLLAPLVLLSLFAPRGLTHFSLPLLILSAGLAAVVYSGGDWMDHHRFISPLLPLLYLSVQESVRAVSIALGNRSRGGPRLLQPAAALGLGALVLGSTLAGTLDKAAAVRDYPYGAPYSVVEARAERLQRLADCIGSRRASVLTPDIGAMSFATELRVIDLVGLADRYIARYPEGRPFFDYIFIARKPDIIETHPNFMKGLDREPRLRELYVEIASHPYPGGDWPVFVYLRRDHYEAHGHCVALMDRLQGAALAEARPGLGPPLGAVMRERTRYPRLLARGLRGTRCQRGRSS
jgi:hypothetical protein